MHIFFTTCRDIYFTEWSNIYINQWFLAYVVTSCGCRMSLLCITSSEVYMTLPSHMFLMQMKLFTVRVTWGSLNIVICFWHTHYIATGHTRQ